MDDADRNTSRYETIILEVSGGIGRLTMNRPGSLNAFNEKMTDEIQSALRLLSENDEVRCVAITGQGRAFSAGQDLKEITPENSFAESLNRRYNPIIKLIVGMQKPVVALINGIAAGAGMSLALACDFRVMSSSAKLIQAFVRIGLVPDSGSTFFLPSLVGYGKAFEFAALGNDITPEEALNLGIVNLVYPDEKFEQEAGSVLQRFASGPTKSYSMIKQMLIHSLTASLDQSLDYEAYMQEIAGRTVDAKEAVRAFIEKRPPRFTGK